MKRMIVLMGAALVASSALAAEAKRVFSEKQLAQQQRMTDCSAEAGTKALKGDARRAFMQTCLSAGSVTVEMGAPAAPPIEDSGQQK